MNDVLTDAEIVNGLRKGDRQAWEGLCQQFSPRLWRHVARLIGSDREAVADVFQETLLAVAKAGRNLQAETRLWPWLATIGHHQAALYWRKRCASRLVNFTPEMASEQTPVDRMLQVETVSLVRTLLADMNADSVTLLVGKYIEGLSVAELVDQLGGTQEAVRSRLARARNDFRQRYETAQKQSSSQVPVHEASPREGDLT